MHGCSKTLDDLLKRLFRSNLHLNKAIVYSEVEEKSQKYFSKQIRR